MRRAGLPGGMTKPVHGYGWTQRIFHIIPLAKRTMWVDESTVRDPTLATTPPLGNACNAHTHAALLLLAAVGCCWLLLAAVGLYLAAQT